MGIRKSWTRDKMLGRNQRRKRAGVHAPLLVHQAVDSVAWMVSCRPASEVKVCDDGLVDLERFGGCVFVASLIWQAVWAWARQSCHILRDPCRKAPNLMLMWLNALCLESKGCQKRGLLFGTKVQKARKHGVLYRHYWLTHGMIEQYLDCFPSSQ